METIERVAQVLVTIDEFSTLLDTENKAIRAADTDTIAKLAERKEFLALHYQRQLKMLADRRADLAELDPKIRQRLTGAWKAFDEKKTENLAALKVAHDATQHVVDLVVQAVRGAQGIREQAYPSRYNSGPYRTTGSAAATMAASCVSLTYNRVL